jgi:hypothetical protein
VLETDCGDTGTGFSPNSSAFPCQYHSTRVPYSCIIRSMNSSETLSITPSIRTAARLNDIRVTSARAGRSLQSAPLVRFQTSRALQSSVEAVHPESQMEPRTELRERHAGLRGCGTDSYHSPINVIGYKLEHPSPLMPILLHYAVSTAEVICHRMRCEGTGHTRH